MKTSRASCSTATTRCSKKLRRSGRRGTATRSRCCSLAPSDRLAELEARGSEHRDLAVRQRAGGGVFAGGGFALEGGDHGAREVDLLELLRAAEAARGEDVDLHELAADDVEADEEHAVLDETRADELGELEHLVGDDGLGELAAGVE